MGGNNKDNNSNNDSKLKSLWNSLPLKYKLIIIGVIAGVVFLILLIGLVVSAVNILFLDYSSDVEDSENMQAEYEEYWQDFCEEGDENCTEEQIEKAKELKESQEKFYKKLDELSSKYSISKKQKYMVLTTIFYGYDIDDFSEGNNAFEVDDNAEIDYENTSTTNSNGENVYKKEQDSLKELIKQFKVNTAVCKGRYTVLSNGETSSLEEYDLRDSNNQTYSFNFFDKFKFTFGINPDDERFTEAKAECERENGTVSLEERTDSEASIEGFYRYLLESTYFDEKPHLSSHFADYAKAHELNPDTNSWTEEDLQFVRQQIIDDIKSIVDEYESEEGPEFFASTGRAYWWPIGSKDTSPGDNGELFAKGDPEYTGINSEFGYRIHPISGKPNLHNGVDLQGTVTSNIIASLGGTVIKVVNECASYNSNGCGGGYGNHVEIQDTKGNINLYAHMYKDSILVEEGETVSQGQVLGKVGSSGNSTGPHLHFTIKVNGQAVNPLDYIDASKPRPASYSSIDFNKSAYTKEEFASRLKTYYSGDVCSNSGCTSFKNEILNNSGAETIYDVAESHNLNPELVVARSILEGYSPGSNYNYFGFSCYNTGGLAACSKFTSFKSAMEAFFNNISQYDSIESMMSRYAYLGDYWYTGTHWDWGGCAYATYIYPDGVPDRVQTACSEPDGTCTIAGEAACVPTNDDDKNAYTVWQVEKMANTIEGIF